MMTCGAYDFLLCKPALPAPDVVVDKSSFEELPLEKRLAIRERDLQQMKEAFRLKESDLEDSQHELKFHAIKNEELMDVINAFRSTSTDRSHEIMRAKAEQNSELTVQVHNLRDLLTKSGDQIAALQKELVKEHNEAEKLTAHQQNHQRLQVQLKGLVKTLNKVEINSVDIPSEWINLKWITGGLSKKTEEDSDKTIQGITKKIIAMEADRQRLLKESYLYNQSGDEKEEKILALERQVRKMQHDQDELQETNESLKQQLTVREGKIDALEELFQNINANRSVEGSKVPALNRRDSLLSVDLEDEDDEDDCESVDIDSMADGISKHTGTLSFEEIFTNIWTSFTGVATEKKEEETQPDISQEEDQEISSCFNDSYHTKQVEEELLVATKTELDQLLINYQAMTENYDSAQFKISDLSAKLEESTIKANSFETKAKLRENLMKDVIQQYKELQMENSATKDQMTQLKQKVGYLLDLEKERHAEQKAREAATAAALVATAAGKVAVEDKAVVNIEETPTFDMSERTRMTSEDETSNGDGESSNNGVHKNYMTEENKRLEGECDRLQHEFESAIEKINDLADSLQEANEDIQKSQIFRADQARTIAILEGEKAALQERVIVTTTRIVDTQSVHTRTEDELKLAELREKKAREKQIQREKDLWDVIEQYKRLADENRNNIEEKEEVEHELMLTHKVKIQRRDLVYEYCKLEKAMEEAVETGEKLAKELQSARSEAAVNKEEAKGVRKRLAGCHFHYKELQQHYDQLQQQHEDNEQRFAKAEKHEALHNSQAESWAAMMENVREKRRAAEEKVDNLGKENEELQQLCNQLQAEMKLMPAEA